MGKKAKIGKQRRDKFYHLAKETGFRSRSAFKLLQLNRKYEFLQKSRVCIDLCAAPGGWLQVASQNMPVSSIVIGVDLVPIRPIHNIITIQDDITSPTCIQALKKELRTWKADVVLNDGAPNVGQNWLFDAYQQAQLTLHAMKIATEILNKGGWFITKIFRSKDYHALLWVFQKFFKKVYATKPQASRIESAEIFVVCQNYLAPDKIDPKFLNAKSVFAEVEPEPQVKNLTTMLLKKKTRAKAEGYPTSSNVLFKRVNISQFIGSKDPVALMADCNELFFDDKKISSHPLTTAEIRECCKDIKVLGRKELKLLVMWHKRIKESVFGKQNEQPNVEVAEEKGDDEDNEEQQIEKAIEAAQMEEAQKLKTQRRKELKKQKKMEQRMNLNMTIKNDEPIIEECHSTFRLSTIRNPEQLKEVHETSLASMDPLVDFDEVSLADESELPTHMFVDPSDPGRYDNDFNNAPMQEKGDDDDDDRGKGIERLIDAGSVTDEFTSADEHDDEEEEQNNPLLMDLDYATPTEKTQRKVNLWFAKDSFAGLEDEDEDFELDLLAKGNQTKKDRNSDSGIQKSKNKTTENKKTKELKRKSVRFEGVDTDNDSSTDDDEGNAKLRKKRKAKRGKEDMENDDFEVVPVEETEKNKKRLKLDCVGLAVGAEMMKSLKAKRNITDNAWNRYTFNDEDLPAWFVKDERRHYFRNLPITKAMIDRYRARQRAIDARQIKKVVEAKARKKNKQLSRLAKARKKAERISDSVNISETEKSHNIKQLYKKYGLTRKKEDKVQYVVSKKALSGKKARNVNIKGRYKMVDPRMKKDDRRRKSLEKKSRKKIPTSKQKIIKKKLANIARKRAKKTSRNN